MPTKLNLIAGAAFFGVIMYDNIQTKIKARQAAEFYLASYEEFEEIQQANKAQLQHLCHMIVKNDVPVDEFDFIVLNYNQ